MSAKCCGECGRYRPASKRVGVCAWREAKVMAIVNKIFRRKEHTRVHRNSKVCEYFVEKMR